MNLFCNDFIPCIATVFLCTRFYLDVKGRNLDTEKFFCLSSSVQVLPLDVTSPRDSNAWNYRELTTLLTLSESLAEVGLEPLTVGSIRKNLAIELSWRQIATVAL